MPLATGTGPDAFVPGVRPDPGACRRVACTDDSPLLVGSTRLQLTFALDLPGAALLGVAALLWIASGAYARALSAGPTEPRAIRRVLADDADWLHRRISGRRHGGLLFSSCAAHARSLRSRHPPRNALAHGAPARSISGSRCWPKSLLLTAFVMLAAQIPGRQPVDP